MYPEGGVVISKLKNRKTGQVTTVLPRDAKPGWSDQIHLNFELSASAYDAAIFEDYLG